MERRKHDIDWDNVFFWVVIMSVLALCVFAVYMGIRGNIEAVGRWWHE